MNILLTRCGYSFHLFSCFWGLVHLAFLHILFVLPPLDQYDNARYTLRLFACVSGSGVDAVTCRLLASLWPV